MTKIFCPACLANTLKEPAVMNALSRYCSIYICNDCGTREAFEGDFWNGKGKFGKVKWESMGK